MYPPIKRTLDFLAALLGLVLLSPALLVVALAVALTSPGPILFTQRRIGMGRREFSMYKFRTMQQDAPRDTPTHMLKDPKAYITPAGRFLRKTSLDELPQLYNILRGDMSFVGPRPALWNQADLIAAREAGGANDIRPGLTGLAQVRGRDELLIDIKAAYDCQYRRDLSLRTDLRICLDTVLQVVRGSGVSEGGPSGGKEQGRG